MILRQAPRTDGTRRQSSLSVVGRGQLPSGLTSTRARPLQSRACQARILGQCPATRKQGLHLRPRRQRSGRTRCPCTSRDSGRSSRKEVRADLPRGALLRAGRRAHAAHRRMLIEEAGPGRSNAVTVAAEKGAGPTWTGLFSGPRSAVRPHRAPILGPSGAARARRLTARSLRSASGEATRRGRDGTRSASARRSAALVRRPSSRSEGPPSGTSPEPDVVPRSGAGALGVEPARCTVYEDTRPLGLSKVRAAGRP